MKKINSIHFGGKMIGLGAALFVLVPAFGWLASGRFSWLLCIPGAVVLMAFLIIFSIEMKQDNAAVPYYEKNLKTAIPFDSVTHEPVLHASICTGEKIAGFRDKTTGHFTEVMLIRSNSDLARFKAIYQISEIKTEY